MNFEDSLKVILKWEGGYSNHPKDRGRETMYGIIKRVALKWGYIDNMKDIPMSLVKEIYRKDYWDKAGCDYLPEHIKLFAFDTAVNLGVEIWRLYLSEGLGVENNWNLKKLYERRKSSYKSIVIKNSEQSVFFDGWINRLNDIYNICQNELNNLPKYLANSPENKIIFYLKNLEDQNQISTIQFLCNSLLGTTLIIDGILGPKTQNAINELYKKMKG